MKNIALILTILFIKNSIYACECPDFENENISEIKNELEFIITGKVVDMFSANKSDYLDYEWKNNLTSFNVIVEVEKVYKGEIKVKDKIYITQMLVGNCSRKFKKGDHYIISGNRIKKFMRRSIKNLNENNPLIKFENNIVQTQLHGNLNKWNKIARRNILIETNECFSDLRGTKFEKYIIK